MGHLPTASKIRRDHLDRRVYVYVRQSTPNQVRENTVSTLRQYDLVKLAADLGWEREKIVVVDQDQARSGTSTKGREGFKDMLSEIALGNVGAVVSLEASRMARDSSAWHQLLKICDVTGALVVDELGVYDPRDPDDRLMLGIKGDLSQAEGGLIRSRLMAARRRKAQDGALCFPIPVGFTRDADGNVILDPHEATQNIFRVFFDTYDRLSSVRMLVREFNAKNLLFPTHAYGRVRPGRIEWVPLRYNRALAVLHNPAYAGAYVYGRTQSYRHIDLENSTDVIKRVKYVSIDKWDVLILDHHEGYITWEKYKHNQERIQDNRNRRSEGTPGAPRPGAALLQGLILCGKCARRVQVRYPKGAKDTTYFCNGATIDFAESKYCLMFQGELIDKAVAELFLGAIKPAQLRLSVRAVERLESEVQQINRQWKLRLEAVQYEAELARRRYEAVDPDNRLVARNLESDWNMKLAEVESLRREMEEATHSPFRQLTAAQREAVERLANDLPTIWHAETTTQVERKQLLRFLIRDITASRVGQVVTLGVRWQTGVCTQLQVRLKSSSEVFSTEPSTLDKIRELAVSQTDQQIADYLNGAGILSRTGLNFTKQMVAALRHNYDIRLGQSKHHVHVPRKDGRIPVRAAAQVLGVCSSTVCNWCSEGLLDGIQKKKQGYWWVKLTPESVSKLKALKPKLFAK